MEPNLKLQKRQYLVERIDLILDLLAYYKTWAEKINKSRSVTLWKLGQQENYCKIDEIT